MKLPIVIAIAGLVVLLAAATIIIGFSGAITHCDTEFGFANVSVCHWLDARGAFCC